MKYCGRLPGDYTLITEHQATKNINQKHAFKNIPCENIDIIVASIEVQPQTSHTQTKLLTVENSLDATLTLKN